MYVKTLFSCLYFLAGYWLCPWNRRHRRSGRLACDTWDPDLLTPRVCCVPSLGKVSHTCDQRGVYRDWSRAFSFVQWCSLHIFSSSHRCSVIEIFFPNWEFYTRQLCATSILCDYMPWNISSEHVPLNFGVTDISIYRAWTLRPSCRVVPCMQCKAKLTQLEVVSHCASFLLKFLYMWLVCKENRLTSCHVCTIIDRQYRALKMRSADQASLRHLEVWSEACTIRVNTPLRGLVARLSNLGLCGLLAPLDMVSNPVLPRLLFVATTVLFLVMDAKFTFTFNENKCAIVIFLNMQVRIIFVFWQSQQRYMQPDGQRNCSMKTLPTISLCNESQHVAIECQIFSLPSVSSACKRTNKHIIFLKLSPEAMLRRLCSSITSPPENFVFVGPPCSPSFETSAIRVWRHHSTSSASLSAGAFRDFCPSTACQAEIYWTRDRQCVWQICPLDKAVFEMWIHSGHRSGRFAGSPKIAEAQNHRCSLQHWQYSAASCRIHQVKLYQIFDIIYILSFMCR